MGEAYWSVVPELEGTCAEENALKTHYGDGDQEAGLDLFRAFQAVFLAVSQATFRFFTEVLSVKPVMSLEEWTLLCQAPLEYLDQD